MSLRVWLPLNKDLRQQGLSNITVTNDGATFDSVGKLGGCYNLTNGPITLSNLPNPSEISVAFWFKRTADTGTRQFMFTAWTGVTCELTTDGKPTFAVNRSGYPTITGNAITASTGWVHYCGTFSTTEGMKLYINGTLVASNSRTDAIVWGTTSGQIGKYGSYASMSALMNDFRIYDHCLSEVEVKKLSQGLVLHYPLNNNGWGQENLWRNSSCQVNLTEVVQTSQNVFSITTKDGYKCAHLSGQLNTTGHLGIPDAMLPTAGEWYTISADMRIDNFVAGTTNPYVGIYFGGDYLNTDNTGGWYGGSSYSGDGKADNHTFVNTYNNKGWHRVTCTVQYLHGGSEYKKGPFRMGYIFARDFTGDLYVKNIKFEKGKIATPWREGPLKVNNSLIAATTVAGVTYTPGTFSNIGVSGTSTGTAACFLREKTAIEPGIYNIYCFGGLSADGVRLVPYKTSGGTTTYYDMTVSGNKRIYIAPGDTYGYYLRTNGNNMVVNTTVWAFHNFESLEEYDISGFGNNGTRTGTPKWTSDTPKYSVSTIYDGNDGMTMPIMYSGARNNKMSFACWIKRTEDFSSDSITFYEGVMRLYINKVYGSDPYPLFMTWNHATSSSTATNTWYPGYKTLLNTWFHMVITFDEGLLKLYINGNYYSQSDRTSTGTYIYNYRGNSFCSDFKGQLSDFRIYTTVLSANEVKSLYQNCATIGPDGTIYGQIRS